MFVFLGSHKKGTWYLLLPRTFFLFIISYVLFFKKTTKPELTDNQPTTAINEVDCSPVFGNSPFPPASEDLVEISVDESEIVFFGKIGIVKTAWLFSLSITKAVSFFFTCKLQWCHIQFDEPFTICLALKITCRNLRCPCCSLR